VRHEVKEERKLIEEQPWPEQERQEAEQSRYIENWIARQPDDKPRQQFADGILSYLDAENLIAAEALDDLLGPPQDYHVCDVCSRSLYRPDLHYDCEKWETHHLLLPPHIYLAWRALKDNLPEGTEWKCYEVFPCLLKRLQMRRDLQATQPLMYIAKLTVPVGPFRFERNVLLNEFVQQSEEEIYGVLRAPSHPTLGEEHFGVRRRSAKGNARRLPPVLHGR
jgi:hypothetical protein